MGEELSKRHINSGRSEINKEEAPRQKFDLVCLQHVLEHVFDIDGIIRYIKTRLKDEGYFFIEVPDAEEYLSFNKKYTKQVPFFFFHPEHINHFTSISICKLAEKYGFEVSCIERKHHIPPMTAAYFVLKNSLSNIKIYKNIDNKKGIQRKIDKYISESKEMLNKGMLYNFIKSKEKLFLWGCGPIAIHLFDVMLKDCNIVDFIDSSKEKQGKQIGNFKIISPSKIRSVSSGSEPIIILAYQYEDEIRKQIESLGIKNPVFSLFNT